MGCHTSKHTYNRHKMAMINSSSSFFLYRLDRISSGSTRIDWINRTDLFANDRKITHRGYFQSHLITIERYIPVTTFLQCKQNIWLYHIARDKYRKNTMLSIPRRLSHTTAAVYIFRTPLSPGRVVLIRFSDKSRDTNKKTQTWKKMTTGPYLELVGNLEDFARRCVCCRHRWNYKLRHEICARVRWASIERYRC